MAQTIQGRHQLGALVGAQKAENFYELHYSSGETARLYILSDSIFRFYLDPKGAFQANALDLNLSSFDNSYHQKSSAKATSEAFIIQTGSIKLVFGQKPATLTIFDEQVHRNRLSQTSPLEIGDGASIEFLKQNQNEYYYGGGLQGGHFSHKGKKIQIKDLKVAGNGGVINPIPFFWSNAGFGELRNTNSNGTYDFGSKNSSNCLLSHNCEEFDTFYLIGNSPQSILQKLYQLTGKPFNLPKYALGLGYLGNFLDFTWKKSDNTNRTATKFEDGDYYEKATSPENVAAKASLNGEESAIFSARAMIDRYHKMKFPLSYFIPDFGSQKPANLDELQSFNEYALSQGVMPGTAHVETLLANTQLAYTNKQNEAKTYSALANSLKQQRPLVLTNNGNAKSFHTSALAFGEDGGEWDTLKNQIASLLGLSLSGQAISGCAVDGLRGGGNATVSVRDFEWKSFTPLLFSMDGQGPTPKLPFVYNNKISKINRAYLALRKQFSSYLYTLIKKAQNGDLIIRPLFMEFPHEKTNYSDEWANEFMLGEDLLIAPITDGREDEKGYAIKDRLYLPDHRTIWIDLFTGKKYAGGRVYNNLSFPIWHLPVFVRSGAILSQGNRIFTIYPQGKKTAKILNDNNLNSDETYTTTITSNLNDDRLHLSFEPIKNLCDGVAKDQATYLNILIDHYPGNVSLKINDEPVRLNESGSFNAFLTTKEGYYFNTNFIAAPAFSDFTKQRQTALQIKLAKRDITDTKIDIFIDNFHYVKANEAHAIIDSALRAPGKPSINPDKTTAHSLTAIWPNDAQVQIEVNDLIYDGISGKSFTFNNLKSETLYKMRLRYLSHNKVSEWSDYFGGRTKPSQYKFAVKNVKMHSSMLSQEGHDVALATDMLPASEWRTANKLTNEGLTLTFNFTQEEELSRMVYLPRTVDQVGRIIKASLAISKDGIHFEPYRDEINWPNDPKNKVVGLRDVKAKAIQMHITESSDGLVAAKQFYFFKPKK